MKALSVKQPWANMIASGEKTIETRTWSTAFKGDLLIVSSKSPKGYRPLGCAVAVVSVIECRPMIQADEPLACCEMYDGAFSWVLALRHTINQPFPVRGQLGIYDVDVSFDDACRR